MLTVMVRFVSQIMAGVINVISGCYIRKLPRATRAVVTTILLLIMGVTYCLYSSSKMGLAVTSVPFNQQSLGVLMKAV